MSKSIGLLFIAFCFVSEARLPPANLSEKQRKEQSNLMKQRFCDITARDYNHNLGIYNNALPQYNSLSDQYKIQCIDNKNLSGAAECTQMSGLVDELYNKALKAKNNMYELDQKWNQVGCE